MKAFSDRVGNPIDLEKLNILIPSLLRRYFDLLKNGIGDFIETAKLKMADKMGFINEDIRS